jgi:hypothetical protein
MKLVIYIMASGVRLNGILHKCLPSVCAYVYVARQRLCKNSTTETNIRATIEELLNA